MNNTISVSFKTLLLATGLSIALAGGIAAAADMPQVQQANGVSYVSGGIAGDSQQSMEQMAGDFNLHLTFAEADGSYLADIPLTIKDAGGNTVLETTSGGPLFYARLEPGSYTITADNQGNSKEQQVEISADKPASITYSW
jgi:hypothetical protein